MSFRVRPWAAVRVCGQGGNPKGCEGRDASREGRRIRIAPEEHHKDQSRPSSEEAARHSQSRNRAIRPARSVRGRASAQKSSLRLRAAMTTYLRVESKGWGRWRATTNACGRRVALRQHSALALRHGLRLRLASRTASAAPYRACAARRTRNAAFAAHEKTRTYGANSVAICCIRKRLLRRLHEKSACPGLSKHLDA